MAGEAGCLDLAGFTIPVKLRFHGRDIAADEVDETVHGRNDCTLVRAQ
jgi:hypothetical protein